MKWKIGIVTLVVDNIAMALKVQVINGDEYIEYEDLDFYLDILVIEKKCIVIRNIEKDKIWKVKFPHVIFKKMNVWSF